jgi:hypothetical protein
MVSGLGKDCTSGSALWFFKDKVNPTHGSNRFSDFSLTKYCPALVSSNWKLCPARDTVELPCGISEKDLPSLKAPSGKSDTAGKSMNNIKTQHKDAIRKHLEAGMNFAVQGNRVNDLSNDTQRAQASLLALVLLNLKFEKLWVCHF